MDALRTRAARAVSEHAPEHSGAALHELGGGLDHGAFVVGDHGAFVVGDLVVRVVRGAESAGTPREAELLALVARHLSIPVPAPRFADPKHGVLAYPLLRGRLYSAGTRLPTRQRAWVDSSASCTGSIGTRSATTRPWSRPNPMSGWATSTGPRTCWVCCAPAGRSRRNTSCSLTPTSAPSTSPKTRGT